VQRVVVRQTLSRAVFHQAVRRQWFAGPTWGRYRVLAASAMCCAQCNLHGGHYVTFHTTVHGRCSTCPAGSRGATAVAWVLLEVLLGSGLWLLL
jgi:hypothetical protein